MDTFPTVRVGYAVIHLSVAPSHTFFPFLFKPNTYLLLKHSRLFNPSSSFSSQLPLLLLLHLLSVFSFFPPQQPYLIVFLSPLPPPPPPRPHSPTFPFKLSHSSLSHPLSLSVCGQSHLIQLHPSVSLHSFSPVCFRLRLHQALTYQCAVILLKSFCGYRLSSKPTTLLTQHNTDSI